ncbi:MAG: hypothetical protein ACI97N_000808, partial [Cognaticolwellia sp.]
RFDSCVICLEVLQEKIKTAKTKLIIIVTFGI